MLCHDYWVAGNQYSQLLLINTGEYQLCTKLCVQEQMMSVTSQYQCFMFALHHRSTHIILLSLQWRHIEHASQITLSSTDQWKHQCSASLAFVRGIHQWPLDSPHKGPVMRKMFPFDDVIMNLTILSDYGKISDRWLYSSDLCVHGIIYSM